MEELQFVRLIKEERTLVHQRGDDSSTLGSEPTMTAIGTYGLVLEQFGDLGWLVQFVDGTRGIVPNDSLEFLSHEGVILEIPEDRPVPNVAPVLEDFDFVQLLVEHDCGNGSPVPAGSLGFIVQTLGMFPDEDFGVVFGYHIHFWDENGPNDHAIYGAPNILRLLS